MKTERNHQLSKSMNQLGKLILSFVRALSATVWFATVQSMTAPQPKPCCPGVIGAHRGARRSFGNVTLGLSLAMLLLSCAGDPASRKVDPPPNVLIIVWDTVRADRLGLYGYSESTTPGIDTFFASDARIYERAISTAPWTVPSHAAMFTGLFPTTSGATHDHKWLDDRFDTLAEHLGQGGFATYLNSANPNVSDETNLSQGFDQLRHPWLDPTGQNAAREERAPDRIQARLSRKEGSQEIVEGFLSWLEMRPRSQPFFAYLNFMEAHWPRRFSTDTVKLLSPAEQQTYRRILDNRQPQRMAFNFGCHEYPSEDLLMMNRVYDDALRRLDRSTSFLLQQLTDRQDLDNTLVIFTSDHGENLGDHHLLGHEFSVHESLLHVPLVIRYPSRFPPGRSAVSVQTSDIFRTVLDATNIHPKPIEGEESYSLLDSEERVPPRRPLVSEYLAPKRRVLSQLLRRGCPEPHFEALRSFELDGAKAIWGHLGRRELYFPGADPHELIDLSSSQPETLQSLIDALDRWAKSRPQSSATDVLPVTSSDARKRLKALGYL